MTKRYLLQILLCIVVVMSGCKSRTGSSPTGPQDDRIQVIFDTDANNELDDQHALAYLLLNEATFHTLGVTVNATWAGGNIEEHEKEALRIVKLCGLDGVIPVLKGADGDFSGIRKLLEEKDFDGREAVDFIISEAMQKRESKLVLIAVGKLTNIALALQKEPSMADRVRLVWLGSNYPDPGEYNLENDTVAMNYLLESDIPFEMVTVRYGKPSGTAAVTVTQSMIFEKMPGLGPHLDGEGVTGRHGGTFLCFGDYSVSLFSHIDFSDTARTRALFDMAAVAIVKDPEWATSSEVPGPIYTGGEWIDRPGNKRKIILWENFDRKKILQDFFSSFESD